MTGDQCNDPSIRGIEMESWSIEQYCASQVEADWTPLSESAKAFLAALELPTLHPFCGPDAPRPYAIPGVPPQGPLLQNAHLETWWDVVVTVVAMGVPSLWGMGELWLRFFAALIAPLTIAHLLLVQLSAESKPSAMVSAVSLLSVTSSLVIMTDTNYVNEFGYEFGVYLFATSVALSTLISWRRSMRRTFVVLICLVILAVVMVYDSETGHWTFGHPHERYGLIAEGTYFDESNPFMQKVMHHWPESYRSYGDDKATWWQPTGDARTGLPFVLNRSPEIVYHRLWLQVADGEAVALDISFPDGDHSFEAPLYMILHGLNGGSHEEFVRDFVDRRHKEGSTVVVMVARGLMDLPIRGWNTFTGARWTDAHEAALAIRKGLGEHQILGGAGYSMGAIILSNYAARAGPECALDAAVAVSGGLDMRFEIDFYRAQRLWQPVLCATLRDDFIVGKWGERVRARLTKDEMKQMMRATHVSEIDKTAVVAYNGYRDLIDYYSDMSALGDVSMEEYASGVIPRHRRIHNISIPFAVIHGLDDPLVTYRTVVSHEEGPLHPTNLTRTGSGNLVLLLTKRGGHVGWPVGWMPHENRWAWMHDAAMSFIHAVDKARTETTSL